MQFTILGSAAAEGWPALFCSCDACAEALRRGGRDLRRRTSYRLGQSVQIDWGPDTYGACLAFGLDTASITDLLVTHSHEDHFLPRDLWYRRPGFSRVAADNVLTVHGSAPVEAALRTQLDNDATFGVRFHRLEPYREDTLPCGLAITPFPAAHATDSGGAFNFIIRSRDRQLLLGNDTGWWEDQVWDFLSTRTLHLVIMDATYGPRRERSGHLGVHEVVEVRQELISRGALADGCIVVANHFSHNGGWLHAELEAFFAPHGIAVGYDGMTLDF